MIQKKPIIIGVIGSLGMASVYFGILTIAESPQHAVAQYVAMWPWITLLLIGFGIQVGLYALLRVKIKARNGKATAEIAATGGVSAAAMIACCAHHLVDFLPILGFSAAAIFLTEFQIPFIVVGIVSNLVGISLMLYMMQKHGFNLHALFFRSLFALNQKRVTTDVAAASILVVASAFFFGSVKLDADNTSPGTLKLSPMLNDENLVTFEAMPINFQFGQPLVLDIKINTHQVDLNFDLLKISTIRLGENAELEPIAWEGSPPGGHHRNGMLTFPDIPSDSKQLLLGISINYCFDIPHIRKTPIV